MTWILGNLCTRELLRHAPTSLQFPKFEVPEETWDAWNAVFDRLDTSGDGVMSAKELRMEGNTGIPRRRLPTCGVDMLLDCAETKLLQVSEDHKDDNGDRDGAGVHGADETGDGHADGIELRWGSRKVQRHGLRRLGPGAVAEAETLTR
ncbi:hypothetical protein AK812_SmicGene2465 [Symbiodinium microadriaticum]|uniref:EF-hand domain-containing protein n=1 Tax=Symbiodinium microadriaticum TaxID=2951 RepID=A0A1Q9F1G8_SYMMI|nr:hypothetical protein AK812_SmicGene2465 [Symbiodinium microadriaticum]